MFKDLMTLQDRMNRLFDEAFPTSSISRIQGEDLFSGTWIPAVDVYEDENATIIKADVPGIDPESLDVRIEDNRLCIRGERKMENEIKRENFRKVERSYGSFMRTFLLPPNVKEDQIEANYKNGELLLRLPKREESQAKQIKISSEGKEHRFGKSESQKITPERSGQKEESFAGAGAGREPRR